MSVKTHPSKAISQALSIAIVIVIILAAFGGYAVGFEQKSPQKTTVTIPTTRTVTSTQPPVTTTSTYTTTLNSTTITDMDSCTPLSSLQSVLAPILLGFEPTVSYQGVWDVSIATFAAKADNASALNYVCTYTGSGTITFYVGLANYSGGWNTMVVLAHKLDSSNATLSVQASMGNETSTNSTTRAYGSVMITISYYLGNQ